MVENPSLENYTEHNEWTLVGYKAFRHEIKYANWIENDTFSEIRYKILIKRKPLFVIQNCVIPAIMLCILSLASFFIPFAQEMQIGISIMLAFSVFKLRLSDDVPVQSDSVPLVNIYFTICMSFSLAAMIWFSIVNLLRESKRVPTFCRSLVLNYISYLTCPHYASKLKYKSKSAPSECLTMYNSASNREISINENNNNNRASRSLPQKTSALPIAILFEKMLSSQESDANKRTKMQQQATKSDSLTISNEKSNRFTRNTCSNDSKLKHLEDENDYDEINEKCSDASSCENLPMLVWLPQKTKQTPLKSMNKCLSNGDKALETSLHSQTRNKEHLNRNSLLANSSRPVCNTSANMKRASKENSKNCKTEDNKRLVVNSKKDNKNISVRNDHSNSNQNNSCNKTPNSGARPHSKEMSDSLVIKLLNLFVFYLFLFFIVILNISSLYFFPYCVKKPLEITEEIT